MAIITITGELATLGEETAQELTKQLDFRFVNRRVLEDRIKSYGIEDQKLTKYDERKPSFLASLSQDRDDYLHYLKTAFFAEAEQGSCVFIGRGATMVFKGMPAHFSIFLAAPLDIRIERVKSYFHCDDRRARQIIEHSDQDRVGFHRYFFDVDWRDPGNYHLALNTGIFYPAACAEIVRQIKDSIFTAETEAQSAVHLKELILEQRVKHHIKYEKELPIHFLEVVASDGTITLYGVTSSQAQIDATVTAAQEVAGSAGVHSEIQVVREYSVMP